MYYMSTCMIVHVIVLHNINNNYIHVSVNNNQFCCYHSVQQYSVHVYRDCTGC